MIGALRHLLTLQTAAETPDGGGGFETTWQEAAENPQVYAAILPLSAQEGLQFRKLATEATHRVKIRYRSDITKAMRLIEQNGAIHEILSIIDIDKSGSYLDILTVVRA